MAISVLKWIRQLSGTTRIHLKADFSLHSSTGSSDAEKRLTPPQGGVFLCLQGRAEAITLLLPASLWAVGIPHRVQLPGCRVPDASRSAI